MKEKMEQLKRRRWFLALVIGVLLLIPTIYSFVFLQAYWDPYGRLDQVPVAIVNEDQGKDGQNFGQTLTDGMVNLHALDLRVENAEQAAEDLEYGNVYAVLTVPSDFTKDILSSNTTEKATAEITFSANQKSNYVISQLLRVVTSTIKQKMSSVVNEKIVVALTEKLRAVPGQVQQINDGIAQLTNGVQKLDTAFTQFSNGLGTLQAGVTKLDTSVGQLQAGAQALATGSAQLPTLVAGIQSAKGGTEQLDTLLQSYTAMVDQIKNDPTLLNNPTFMGTFNLLQYGILQGSAALKDGTTLLADNSEKLNTLAAGIQTLANGVDQLKAGTSQLSGGADALVTGADKIQNEGLQNLLKGLNAAETKISDSLATTTVELSKLDGLSDYAANPVAVNETPANPVATYGVAFAPFFISLSLWVGAFVLFVVLYSDRDRRFKNCDMDAKQRFKRTACYIAAAVAQGLILGVLLKWTLNLEITNWALYLSSLVLISIMFEAIIEFFIVFLSDFGKFLVLILLIVQVAASGGTFPIEVVSGNFQWLYNFLPMHYSIELLKESTVTLNPNTLLPNIILVTAIATVFLTINIVGGIVADRQRAKREQAALASKA